MTQHRRSVANALLPVAVVAALALSTATAAEVEFAPRVDRWGVPEITLRSSKSYSNPFTEVRLRGRFYCRDIRVEAEGFYDGDQTWKVRLMPTHQGRWLFETVSNDPELNGQKGEFDAVSPGPGNHGPVVVRNQYHFAFGDGAGYFPLGTTLYNWVQRESSLQERTLAALKRSPFNKVRFCVFPKWYPFNRVEPPLYPYRRAADEGFDLERFNPEFFRHIERRLRDLQAIEIEADLILFHPHDRWGFSKMDQAHDDACLHYVIARLAPFRNV